MTLTFLSGFVWAAAISVTRAKVKFVLNTKFDFCVCFRDLAARSAGDAPLTFSASTANFRDASFTRFLAALLPAVNTACLAMPYCDCPFF